MDDNVIALFADTDDRRFVQYADFPWRAPDLSRAARVIAFVESLPVTKGFNAGQPMHLMPFQREWLEGVYRTGNDNARLVRTGLLSIGRGNGKSVLAAALCLAHLVGPEAEPRGECYSAGATKEQASLIFAEVEAWTRAVPWIGARLNVQRFHKVIEDDTTGSVYRALASDGPAAHGLAASFVICDELAQWKKRELFDVLRTSMGKRREPLLLAIGTQSPRADNIMSELVDEAGRVERGEVDDPSFFGRVYSVPEDADAFDPASWPLANPALGVFRSATELRQEAERARRMPTFEAAFRNLYLNQRVDAEPKAINPGDWAACGAPVSPAELRGRPCYGGLDLSSTTDLTALVLYFPEDGGAVLPFFWCPKDGLSEREEKDRVPYRTWAKAGHIEATPGRAIDKRAVAARLATIMADYDVRGIAFDRYGIAEFRLAMEAEGISAPLSDWGQGFRDMAAAVNAFETAILNRELRHGQQPVLRWNAANLVFDTDPAGNRKPAKNRSIDKIDGVVALIMAIGMASRAEKPKVYSGAGVQWL